MQVWGFVATALSLALIIVFRVVLMRSRVLAGCFGTNEHEARELIEFLRKLYESSDARLDPPGTMRQFAEEVERVGVPHDAEVAL
jgi:hypothetical protein